MRRIHAIARTRIGVPLALLACQVLASCSNDGNFELTLILRDDLAMGPSRLCTADTQGGERCRFEIDEQVWRDEAGRQAIVPARTLTLRYVEQGHGDHECGGRILENSWAFRHETLARDSDPYRFELDDGSALVLAEGRAVEVGTSPFTDYCVDSSGSWRGVAGDLEGRTGSFRSINDSVQVTMTLTEE